MRRAAAARVTLVDVDGEGAGREARRLGGEARVRSRGTSSEPATLPEHVSGPRRRARGPVDVLVNCAGIMESRSLGATDWRLAERLLPGDLARRLRLLALRVPSMVARGSGAPSST